MKSILKECLKINDIFESKYIYKSIVVCKTPKYFYHIHNILKNLIFPVEILTHDNFTKVLSRFHKGEIRMIIVNEMMLNILVRYFVYEIKDVNLILLSENIQLKDNWYFDDNNIFSL
jgi:hypothetical protein